MAWLLSTETFHRGVPECVPHFLAGIKAFYIIIEHIYVPGLSKVVISQEYSNIVSAGGIYEDNEGTVTG